MDTAVIAAAALLFERVQHVSRFRQRREALQTKDLASSKHPITIAQYLLQTHKHHWYIKIEQSLQYVSATDKQTHTHLTETLITSLLKSSRQ